MNFVFKIIFIVGIYALGYYMGLNAAGSGDHVGDTLEHLNELKSQGVKHGKELIETIKDK